MASIASALARAKIVLQTSLSESAVDRMAWSLGHRWRDRLLGPGATLRLLLTVSLCGLALAGLRVASTSISAAAMCQARCRLPLALFELAIEALNQRASTLIDRSSSSPSSSPCGLSPVIVDGMSLRGSGQGALARRFGRAKNGRATRGPSQLKLTVRMDCLSGMLSAIVLLPWRLQEHGSRAISGLFRTLGKGDLLIADRLYSTYWIVALTLHSQAQCLIRLPKDRLAPRLNATLLSGDEDDAIVRWRKPRRRPQRDQRQAVE